MSIGRIVCHSDTDCQLILSADQSHGGCISAMSGDMPDTIASRIRRLRRDRPEKPSQHDVAVAINISRSHYAGIEAGSQFPSRELLSSIAEYFETTVDMLLFGIMPQDQLMKLIQDPDERAWLMIWRDASPVVRKRLIGLMASDFLKF